MGASSHTKDVWIAELLISIEFPGIRGIAPRGLPGPSDGTAVSSRQRLRHPRSGTRNGSQKASYSRNYVYYSLWYYSTDDSSIGLRMQPRRSHRSPQRTAEGSFGRVLRELREEQGFTQEELAFKSGYHTTYIGQLERGRKSPSLRTLMSLAVTLKVSGSELLRRVEVILAKGR